MSREIDIAWAAGFFDGTGSIGLSNGVLFMQASKSVDPGEPPPPELQRFADVVGLGKLSQRTYGDRRAEFSDRRRRFKWYLRGDACREVVNLLWTEISPRQQARAQAAFDQVSGA